MVLTLGSVAAVAFAIALTLLFKHMAKKTVVWLMLIAGIGLGGVVGSLADGLVTRLVGGLSNVAGSLLGATAAGGLIVVAVLTVLLYPHMKPKGQPPTKFTPWLAFFFPAVLVAAGGVFSSVAGLSENVVTQAAGVTWSTIAAVIGGF
jgi:hypothetical protein